jgi:hypothetical protein
MRPAFSSRSAAGRGEIRVGLVHVHGDGQLAFEGGEHLRQFGQVLGSGPPARRRRTLRRASAAWPGRSASTREQGRAALAMAGPSRPWATWSRPRSRTGPSRRRYRPCRCRGQHGGGRSLGDDLGGGGQEGVQLGTVDTQDQAGIGAELARAQGQGGRRSPARWPRRAPSGALGRSRTRIDAAHLGVERDRLGAALGDGQQGQAAAARTGEAGGLDARVGDQPWRPRCRRRGSGRRRPGQAAP